MISRKVGVTDITPSREPALEVSALSHHLFPQNKDNLSIYIFTMRSMNVNYYAFTKSGGALSYHGYCQRGD